MFQLSPKALAEIEKHRPGIISLLAIALKCTDQSINRFFKENRINGDLTKAAALKIIREQTGLSESEILKDLNKNSITKKTQAA